MVAAIVAVVACSGPPSGPIAPGPSADISGRWLYRNMYGNSSIVITDEALLEVGVVGGVVSGWRRRGLREGLTGFTTYYISQADVPISGQVIGDAVTLVFDINVDGMLDSLQATVLGQRLLGNSGWRATWWFGQPIDEAKARVGDTVSVSGTVLVDQGALRAQRDLTYIQDHYGAVEVFGVDTGLALQAGDSVEVRGMVAQYHGEPQIIAAPDRPLQVRRIGTGRVPLPHFLSDLAAQWAPYEGQLVRAYLTPFGADALPGGAYLLRVGASRQPLVYVGAVTAHVLPAFCWSYGSRYSIAGVLGSFDGIPQLQMRSPTDAGFPVNGCSVVEPSRPARGWR